MILLVEFIMNENKILTLNNILKVVITILIIDFFISYLRYGQINTPYSNRNALTTLFVFISPIFFAEIIDRKNIIKNIILLFFVGNIIILSDSRLNLLTFFIQITLAIIFIVKNCKFKFKKIIIIFILIILITTAPFIILKISKSSRGNLIDQFKDETSSLSVRIHFIKEGYKIFLNNPIFGVGSGNIEVKRYIIPTDQTINNLHFFIIDILAKYGIITFVLFVYLYYKLIKGVFIEIPKNYNLYFLKYALIIFLISFPISSNTISTVFNLRAFYFIFGYFVTIISKYENKGQFKKEYINE